MPRYYSVSSSPLKDPTKLSIAFTVVEYTTKPPGGGGAATKKGKKLAQIESTAVRVTDIGVDIGANASADIGAGVCRKSGSKSNESGIGGSAVAMRPILRKGLCTSWLERLATPMLLASEQEAGKPGESKMGLTVGHRGSRSSTCSSFGQSETSNSDVDIDGDSAVAPTMRTEADPRMATPTPPLPIRIPLYIRETKEFALPANHKYPIIMIGPGTGVAPFIGFLEHRQRQCAQQSDHKDDVCSGLWRGGFELDGLQDDDEYSGQRINNVYGECVLFFGNRNRAKDFLYESRLNEFLQDGTLTQLHVAFSRDTQKKVYVQHKMLEQAASIYRMLVKENGYIYVCGDGAKMAKDVDRALMMILSTQGGKVRQGVGGAEAAEMAKTLVEKLKKQGRYVKDVWS
jgi:sulfite reductase alpha subunit-like flavoprotein